MAHFDNRIEDYVSKIDDYLESVLPQKTIPPTDLHKAMHYAVMNGGKRMRPLLVYATGEALEIETDYLANSDVTMPYNIKTWRQSLRDIPANHTNENAYDLLLARDSDGKLTHSMWSKP